MKPPSRDPEQVVSEFAFELTRAAVADHWIAARTIHDGSDCAFRLHRGPDNVNLLAKLSQSEKGFWGLQCHLRTGRLAPALLGKAYEVDALKLTKDVAEVLASIAGLAAALFEELMAQ